MVTGSPYKKHQYVFHNTTTHHFRQVKNQMWWWSSTNEYEFCSSVILRKVVTLNYLLWLTPFLVTDTITTVYVSISPTPCSSLRLYVCLWSECQLFLFVIKCTTSDVSSFVNESFVNHKFHFQFLNIDVWLLKPIYHNSVVSGLFASGYPTLVSFGPPRRSERRGSSLPPNLHI